MYTRPTSGPTRPPARLQPNPGGAPPHRPFCAKSVKSAAAASARRAWLPERLVAAEVRAAREDEEQVGEPVEVDERERVHVDLLRREQRVALRAPAHRPRDVEPRRRLRPARQDEAA